MAVNKVEFGGNTLIDLTGDTLESAEQLMKGIVAHCKDGSVVEGTLEADSGGTLTVTAPAGAYVILSEDGSTVKEYKIANSNGIAIFKGLKSGVWYVGISDGEKFVSKTVTITTDYSVLISFNAIPEFTYTGDFEIVNDADAPITTSDGNWKIRFLTSGVLTFTALNGAADGIDLFLVGGGAGGSRAGAGAGYTETCIAVNVLSGTQYEIVVGAGGNAGVGNGKNGGDGGSSSAFGRTADGGKAPTSLSTYTGGNGGSGGGSGVAGTSGYNGGTDGGDGYGSNGGKGQGSTTREFAESDGKLYATGGKGAGTAQTTASVSGKSNTGDGGSGAGNGKTAGSGGSGIVIIRNHREAVTA